MGLLIDFVFGFMSPWTGIYLFDFDFTWLMDWVLTIVQIFIPPV